MGQRWYKKASVQVAMVSAACAILLTVITIWHQRSELRSENKTLVGELEKTKESLHNAEADNKTLSRDLRAREESLRKAEADNKTLSRDLKAREEAFRNAETDKKALSRDLTIKEEELRRAETNYKTVSRDLEKTKEDLRKAEAPIALDPNLLSRIDKALGTYETFQATLKQNYQEDIKHFISGIGMTSDISGYTKRADYTLRLMQTVNQQTQSTIRELRVLLGIAPEKSDKSGLGKDVMP